MIHVDPIEHFQRLLGKPYETFFYVRHVESYRQGDRLRNIVVFVSQFGRSRNSCRVKISNLKGSYSDRDTFTLKLDGEIVAGVCKLNTTELENVRKWLNLNRETILDYWLDKLSTPDMIDKIKSI